MAKERIDLPKDFIANMISLLGEEEAKKLFISLEKENSPTSIRLNKSKYIDKDIFAELEEIAFSPNSYYLNERPLFTGDPLFHSGHYYVQEASSMSIASISELLDDRPIIALDLAAAPGGKSTLLRDILPQNSVLVANEPISNRASILKENLQKWGNIDTIVTNEFPEKFEPLGNFFDLILLDAPCSGEGMFRKDNNARAEWSQNLVNQCQIRQRNIIDSAVKLLKKDGILLYSTCTFNREENEDNVDYILDNYDFELIKLNKLDSLGLKSQIYDKDVYRFMPHFFEGEGLFLSAFRKNYSENTSKKIKKSKAIRDKIDKPVLDKISSFLNIDAKFILEKDSIWAMTEHSFTIFEALENAKIKMISKGLELAYLKGKSIIPTTQLALSTAIKEKTFTSKELDLEKTLRILRGEAININEDMSLPNDYILVKYDGKPISFVKNIGNRSNNLYPNSWRILKNIDDLLKSTK